MPPQSTHEKTKFENDIVSWRTAAFSPTFRYVIRFRDGNCYVGLKMLSAADLGVTDIDAHEEEFQEPIKGFSQKVKALFPEFRVPEKMTIISLRHRSTDGSGGFLLPLQHESDGTVAYFSLLGPVIQALSEGALLCVDELDESLHPLLALDIVRQFNTAERNPKGAQLLFNTQIQTYYRGTY